MKSHRLAPIIAIGLAVSVKGEALIGLDIGNDALYEINRINATATYISTLTIGGTGDTNVTGLAFDSNRGILYGISPTTDNLYRIDLSTGNAFRIGVPGALGTENANGLAYDSSNDVLYATDNNSNTLLTVDVNSGVGTTIASIGGGWDEIEGLGFDSQKGILYGISGRDNAIVTIDVSTGMATPILAGLSPRLWRGMTFDPERGTLFVTKVNTSLLYEINPSTQSIHAVGLIRSLDFRSLDFVQGLAIVPEPTTFLLVGIGGIAIVRRPSTRHDPLAGTRGCSARTPPASKPPRKAPGEQRRDVDYIGQTLITTGT